MTLYDKYLQNYGKTWGLAVLQKKNREKLPFHPIYIGPPNC